jgi:membrane fusion protein (multidrug efflux system)
MEVKVTIPLQPQSERAATPAGSPTTTGTQPSPTNREKHSGRTVVLGLVVVLLLSATAAGVYLWWQHVRTWEKTDNAFVAGHIHQVSARIAGTALEVIARENDRVTEGAVLARLDRADLEMKRRQAQAQLAVAEAEIARAASEIARTEATLEQQRASLRKTELDLERATQLFHGNSGAISKQEFDHAAAAHEAQQAATRAAESAVKSAEALRVAGESQHASAAAALADAELQLSYTEIRAPAAGRIGRKNLEAGNRVQPGQALMALVAEEIWIVANFKETQLARMNVGQTVRLKLDAFPRQLLLGRVDSFSPASGAQFALLPPDNATGNFTRIVQRVPVKITLNPESLRALAGRIVPGMSAIVEVLVGE